jgi:hypothetical protein
MSNVQKREADENSRAAEKQAMRESPQSCCARATIILTPALLLVALAQ